MGWSKNGLDGSDIGDAGFCWGREGRQRELYQYGAAAHKVVSDRAAYILRDARHVVVFTGAGVSAESGVPTFRDALTGLWERFDVTELARRTGFAAIPRSSGAGTSGVG